jgi:hypothetical protein|tara:strand:+ start:7980 stop:8405 length:426 start_codon:yes stop_codon:yes gene_type:complete
MRKPRKARPKQKNVPKGYDSRWEYDIHKSILKKWEHHKSEVIQYTVTHTYEPDFVKTIGRKVILLEAKGRFWDYAEYSKYVWIRKSLPKHVELVFLFQKPYSPMPQAKKRKDGTKRTHAEWAEKNNFKWYSEETLPEEWKK